MAQKDGSRFSAAKVGQASGVSYTVTLDTNPSVEQVQTYTTKPQMPTNYVPSSSEFDFMSMSPSPMGSPTGMLGHM